MQKKLFDGGRSQRHSESGSRRRKLQKKEWKWQSGIVTYSLSESQWSRVHFSTKKWESEKHKSWSMPVEGCKGHMATDGSLPGKTGKWGACGSAVEKLDYDEEMESLLGMYGSAEAEHEVQRTIKRAELAAFSRFLQKVFGPSKVHVGNKFLQG